MKEYHKKQKEAKDATKVYSEKEPAPAAAGASTSSTTASSGTTMVQPVVPTIAEPDEEEDGRDAANLVPQERGADNLDVRHPGGFPSHRVPRRRRQPCPGLLFVPLFPS